MGRCAGSGGEAMILTGWKSIAREMGGCSVLTAKRRAKKLKMPIVYIGGKPTITEQALERWWNNLKDNAYGREQKTDSI